MKYPIAIAAVFILACAPKPRLAATTYREASHKSAPALPARPQLLAPKFRPIPAAQPLPAWKSIPTRMDTVYLLPKITARKHKARHCKVWE